MSSRACTSVVAIPFIDTLETKESYSYWEQTMSQIYKGDYKEEEAHVDHPLPSKSYTIDILDEWSIKEQKDTIDYWQHTMSKVYELYPDMAGK
jgi:hypothetical protein